MHFLRLLAVCWPGAQKCMRQSRSYSQLCQIFTDVKFFFTRTLSNKPFLIWLLTTPPHLKYVATLPCNLSLRDCFADINVSQGSVATYARCGGILNIHLTADLPRNLPVIFLNRSRFDRIWSWVYGPLFWPTLLFGCTSTSVSVRLYAWQWRL